MKATVLLCLISFGLVTSAKAEAIYPNISKEVVNEYLDLSDQVHLCEEKRFLALTSSDKERQDKLFRGVHLAADKIGLNFSELMKDKARFINNGDYSAYADYIGYVELPNPPTETVPGGVRLKMSYEEWNAEKAKRTAIFSKWCSVQVGRFREMIDKFESSNESN